MDILPKGHKEKLVRAYQMFSFDFRDKRYAVQVRYGDHEAFFYEYAGPMSRLQLFLESFVAMHPGWNYMGKRAIYALMPQYIVYADGEHFIQAEALKDFAIKKLVQHFDALHEAKLRSERIRNAEIVVCA